MSRSLLYRLHNICMYPQTKLLPEYIADVICHTERGRERKRYREREREREKERSTDRESERER